MKNSLYTKIVFLFLFLFVIVIIIGTLPKTDIDTYKNLITNKEFIYAVIFSIKTSITATILSFCIGVPVGLYLSMKKNIFTEIADIVFSLPLVIPPLVSGVLLLSFFSICCVKDIFPVIFTPAGAVIAQFFVAVPLTVKTSKSAFSLVPPIYEMVAMTLGSKPLRAFYDTTFKIALPGILSGVVLTWMRCMGEFGATLIVAGGIPFKTENIPVNIYLNMNSGNFKIGIAASIVSVFFIFILMLFLKYSVKKITCISLKRQL